MNNPTTPFNSDLIPNLPNEVWKAAQGYNDKYLVSTKGRVKSLFRRNEHLLRPGANRRGYLRVSLWDTATRKASSVAVHRLVMLTFAGPPPDGMQVNHKNGNKADNRSENLEFVTPGENLRHSYNVLNRHHVRGEQHGRAKLSENDVQQIRRLIGVGVKIKSIAAAFGVSPATIYDIRAGKHWSWLPFLVPDLENA
jgi:HNH endonuclease/NUMOD4 motif/Helix-turn-helix domain of resolvase